MSETNETSREETATSHSYAQHRVELRPEFREYAEATMTAYGESVSFNDWEAGFEAGRRPSSGPPHPHELGWGEHWHGRGPDWPEFWCDKCSSAWTYEVTVSSGEYLHRLCMRHAVGELLSHDGRGYWLSLKYLPERARNAERAHEQWVEANRK